MIAPRMSGEKGARPASSMLVPRLACLATLVERATTCRCKATIVSWGGGGGVGATASRAVVSRRLCCPTSNLFHLRTEGVEYRPPPP
ncbi:hypothetical protein LIER_24758 [Lithospermum erythrorhizon]|uniref:Secreted protein n=1 Tax=Lithospermum erythrorhizon TaxID=34254 RepID=A0AAV3R3S8_LITER